MNHRISGGLPPPRHALRATPPPAGGEAYISPLLFKEGWRKRDGVVGSRTATGMRVAGGGGITQRVTGRWECHRAEALVHYIRTIRL